MNPASSPRRSVPGQQYHPPADQEAAAASLIGRIGVAEQMTGFGGASRHLERRIWALCGRPGRGQGLLDFNLEEPSLSDLGVFGEGQRVLDVDAEVPHRALFVWPRRICTARKLPVCL